MALLEADGVADVPVSIDEAGDDGLACERDALRAVGHRHSCGRANRGDAALADDDGGVVDWRAVRAVDDARAGEGFDTAARLCR